MSSGIGPIHWVAPEFFTGRYTEKAGVFSLGTLFFAILARDSIVIDGKIIYGAFVNISGAGKVGLGLAMAQFDPRIEIEFPSYAQGPYNLQRVALKTLQYNPEVRPSAQQVYEEVISIRQQQYSLQQPQFLQPTATAFPPTTPPGFAPAAAFLPPTTPPVFTQTAAGFPLTTPSGFAPAATVLPLTTPPSFASTTVPWPQFWPQPPQ